jgi:hypothetical protein
MAQYKTFRELKSALPRVSGHIEKSVRGFARSSAIRVHQNMVDMLGTDGDNWPDITEETRRKRFEDHDSGPLLDTSAMKDALAVIARKEPGASTHTIVFYIGVPHGATQTTPSGASVDIGGKAKTMEFGGPGLHGSFIPARPFMRPALLQERAHLARGGRQAVKDGIDKALRGLPLTAGDEVEEGLVE